MNAVEVAKKLRSKVYEVEYRFWVDRGKVGVYVPCAAWHELNLGLNELGDEERIAFLKDLIQLWQEASDDDSRYAFRYKKVLRPQEEVWSDLEVILEKKILSEQCSRLMFTLTSYLSGGDVSVEDAAEFRCWYDKPYRIEKDHVDSSSGGLLFSVGGKIALVNQYVDQILFEYDKKSEITLPNGVKIYGLYWG